MGTQLTSHNLSGIFLGLTAYQFPLTETLITSCSDLNNLEDADSDQCEKPKTP